jgi:hypothetical protein
MIFKFLSRLQPSLIHTRPTCSSRASSGPRLS